MFRTRLLECTDISDAKVLDHYVAGLKQGMRDWLPIHNPSPLHEAAQCAQRYDNTYFSHGKTNAALQQTSGSQIQVGHRQ